MSVLIERLRLRAEQRWRGPKERQLDTDAADELSRLSAKIAAHDAECTRLCADTHHCGFKVYGRRCPECPMNWLIDE